MLPKGELQIDAIYSNFEILKKALHVYRTVLLVNASSNQLYLSTNVLLAAITEIAGSVSIKFMFLPHK